MRRNPAGWVLGSLFGLILIGTAGGLRAGEPPSDKMLEKRGLKRAGPLFVLEAEATVHDKAQEVRDLSRQWKHAVAQQRSTLSEKEYQDTIKELNNELNQLKAQSNAATQTMNRLPKMRTRRGTYYANNEVTEEAQELNYYKNLLQMQISQETAYLNRLRSQPFDPKARIKADAEVRTREEALHQAVIELRTLVDEVRAKYAEVEKDSQVKKWLETPEGPARVKPKLGPSRAFLQEVKMLEQLERDSSPDEPGTAAHKTSRKGHRPTRAKRPASSDNAASPF